MKTCAVEIQEEQRVGKGVTQPVLVQWTVSVSHVNAFFQEAAGEKASGGVVAGER